MILIRQVSIDCANHLVERWHRHSDAVPPVQARACFAMHMQDGIKGVAIIGNPCGRPKIHDKLELRRVAFQPGIEFSKLREEHNRDVSQRKFLVCGCNSIGNIFYVAKSHEIPSAFIRMVHQLTHIELPQYQTVWTYIREGESGTYLRHAGYRFDRYIHRRGVGKFRYKFNFAWGFEPRNSTEVA